MYIEPSSVIKFYKNVPLDNTYEHTLFFANLTAQNNYFHAKPEIIIRTLTAQSYQRVIKGRCRVQIPSEILYNCNYMAFQNTRFGSKWFYAFVLGVEYVNNEVCEVQFEIDSIQTYLFDFTFKESFIEREHSETDNVGDNIVGENLNVGDYMFSKPSKHLFTDWVLVLQTVPSNENSRVMNIESDGICTTLSTIISPFPVTQTWINNEYAYIVEKNLKVVNAYMLPYDYIRSQADPFYRHFVPTGVETCGTELDGYTPKNKKLLTYPYNMLNLYSSDNNEKDYKYEFAWYTDRQGVRKNGLADFVWYMENRNDVSCMLTPSMYLNQETSLDNGVFIDNFPKCSWSDNTYQEYKVRNSQRLAIGGILGGIGSITAPLVAGSGVGLAVAGVNTALNVLNTVNEVESLKHQPKDIKGNTGNGYFISRYNFLGYIFRRKYINKQSAEVIDNYFTKYGYATKLNKIPNLFNGKGRPHWNYIKTIGALIQGNMPSDEIKNVCSIFDKGITFWNNASEVGNYSLDNSPTV